MLNLQIDTSFHLSLLQQMTTKATFFITIEQTQFLKLLIISLLFLYTFTQNDQNFTYFQSDSVIILPNQTLGLSTSMTTTTDQYLSQSQINLTTNIIQISNNGQLIYYNFLYFNLTFSQGMSCYQNWVLGTPIPYQTPCPTENKLLTTLPCLNFSQCYNQVITYQVKLNKWEDIQNLCIIQNPHFTSILYLQTQITVVLISSNLWFFLGVGLTCILLIMIVVLTGVVFYWTLKYKRTKKVYDQYKLTIDEIDFKKEA